jgi:enoyl-CoA hydratase
MKGASTTEAVTAFARLWVADEHWAAADRVMKK